MKSIIAEILRQWNVRCEHHRQTFSPVRPANRGRDSGIGSLSHTETTKNNKRKMARERASAQPPRAYYRIPCSTQDRAKIPPTVKLRNPNYRGGGRAASSGQNNGFILPRASASAAVNSRKLSEFTPEER